MYPVVNRQVLTGIILAGGEGRRMNNPDKGFLKIRGMQIIERLVKRLNPIFKEILIVTNRQNLFNCLGVRLVGDIIKNKGSLAGIHSGLVNSKTFYNFVFACDMPFVNSKFVEYMMKNIEDNNCVIPKWKNKIEPLHAIYSKGCIKLIEKHLGEGRLRIAKILPKVKVKYITEKEIKRFDTKGSCFTNINTIEDYQTLK
ncbi:MAG: molybdenum cofactor guanylyltransferase [Candidatus Omnitrophica bacterium]|nr:molybdenum cofactor guanylyltransferase [Candidatus Omnitrophota bacterium]